MNLDNLFKIIQNRKIEMPENSYVATLLKKGKDLILQKIGEEATEVIIASKNNFKKEIIYEVSDLFFMILVLLAKFDITLEDIYQELKNRNKS